MAKQATEKENKNIALATTVNAVARYVHISPRKTRLVADLIRGRRVGEAIIYLRNLNKRTAAPVLKVLLSAVANAEHNFKLNKELLKISAITIDKGPVTKRYKPRAYGRASQIRRPTSHIAVTLTEVGQAPARRKGFAFPVIARRAKKEKVEAEEGQSKEQRKAAAEDQPKGARPKRGFFGVRKSVLTRKGGEK